MAAKCCAMIELYGEGEVLVHAQPCHRAAVYYIESCPFCQEHVDGRAAQLLAAGKGLIEVKTVEQWEEERDHKRVLRALEESDDDDHTPRVVRADLLRDASKPLQIWRERR